MGGLETKLVSLLQERKLAEALELWLDSPKLREQIDPNAPMKWTWNKDGDTPLHCAARYGSKPLLWLLLNKGGDPFVRNAKGETPMHLVCTSSRHDPATDAVQADLLEVLLSKIPEVTGETTYDIICGQDQEGDNHLASGRTHVHEDELNLGIVDKARNTPLHLAAASGLKGCVEVLLAHGAPLFVHNVAGQTPCEAAAQAKHEDIAKLLECKMVLMESSYSSATAEEFDKLKTKNVFHADSLQALKKEIVSRVAFDLEVAEFPAEALLKAYGWSQDLLASSWKENMLAACEKAGLSQDVIGGNQRETLSSSPRQCEICWDNIHRMEGVHTSCDHRFCHQCMAKYLEIQINEGGGKEIRCPSSSCYMVVPNDILEALLPEGLFQRYTDFNIKHFVGSFKDMKWCPYPGCNYAIKLPEGANKYESTEEDAESSDKGINIVCGQGHWACWTCLQEAHEPCDCNMWRKWKEIISKMKSVDNARNKAAIETEKWILGHTKPCPNCSIPIQKKEGCNEVTCKNCGHKFCWLCLDPWENHSHKTGGSFFCNRYGERAEVRKKLVQSKSLEMRRRSIEDMIKTRKCIEDKTQKRRSTEELTEDRARFMHYYNHYQNHLQSIEIEQKLMQESTAKSKEMSERLESFVAKRKDTCIRWCSDGSITTSSMLPVHSDIHFLEDAVLTLLRSRQILSSSYAFGFFFSDLFDEHHVDVEDLQGKLEEMVETLSQMVNRPYLCTPHSTMAATTRSVDSLCDKYLKSIRHVA